MEVLKWYTMGLVCLGTLASLLEAVFGPDEKTTTKRRTLNFWTFVMSFPAAVYLILSM